MFSYKESEMKKMPPGSSATKFHFIIDGSSMHIVRMLHPCALAATRLTLAPCLPLGGAHCALQSSEEAKTQLQRARMLEEAREEKEKKLKAQAQASGMGDSANTHTQSSMSHKVCTAGIMFGGVGCVALLCALQVRMALTFCKLARQARTSSTTLTAPARPLSTRAR